MKNWIEELYIAYWSGIPFEELRAYIGNGGQHIEWIEDIDFPMCEQTYRYREVQKLIDNELTLKQMQG